MAHIDVFGEDGEHLAGWTTTEEGEHIPDPVVLEDGAQELNQQRKVLVLEYINRSRELGVGFGNDALFAAKLDTLVEMLFGPMEVDEEDEEGGLIQGTVPRLEFEIAFAQCMLDQVNTVGVEAALLPGKLEVTTNMPNRAERRAMQRRK